MIPSPLEAVHHDGRYPVLRLKRSEERRLAAGHLWIFSNEVDTDASPLSGFRRGELVQVQSDRGRLMGHAYLNPNALICARLLTRDARPIDAALIAERLQAALELRAPLYSDPYYRWVFGESDALPGLVLDRYGDIVVGQIATAGMDALRPLVDEAIRTVLAPATLYWKNDSAARALEQLPSAAEAAFGPVPERIEVIEGGVRFSAPLAGGQKTGWFFDQSWNRARLQALLPRAARVLDVCSYVGAWAVRALRQGARAATCIDSSQSALEFAARNAAANAVGIETLRADAFDALRGLHEGGARFDTVILDPPSFIKRKKDIPQGQAAYRKLNQLALQLIEGEGLLVSCSCSYHLAESELIAAVQAAARHAQRSLQIIEIGGQSPDHPIHPAIPETRYLKALFCRVRRA